MIALKSELAGAARWQDDPARARAEMADVQRVARESLPRPRDVGGYRRVEPRDGAGRRPGRPRPRPGSTVGSSPALGVALPAIDRTRCSAWAVREVRHEHPPPQRGPGPRRSASRPETDDGGGGDLDDRRVDDRRGRGTAAAVGRPGSGAGDARTAIWARAPASLGLRRARRPRSAARSRRPGLPDGGFRLRVRCRSDDPACSLAEDQALVRGALAALLGLEHDLEVVAEVARGDEVVAAALETAPDVALLDIEMPGLDGLAAAAQLRDRPARCRVLIVTTFGRPGYLRRAMEAGARGFLSRTRRRPSSPRRSVASPPASASSIRRWRSSPSEGTNPLSMREREVLATSLEVATIAEMASRLSLSEGTVRNHLSAAIQKARRAQPGRGGADRRREGLARAGRRSLTARSAHEAHEPDSGPRRDKVSRFRAPRQHRRRDAPEPDNIEPTNHPRSRPDVHRHVHPSEPRGRAARGTGKKVAAIRREGRLPAVVFGHGIDSENVSLDAHEFDLLRRHVGQNALIDLSVHGEKPRPVLIHGVQVHPVHRRPLHVDLFLVRMTEELIVDVPLVSTGVSRGHRGRGRNAPPSDRERPRPGPSGSPPAVDRVLDRLAHRLRRRDQGLRPDDPG